MFFLYPMRRESHTQDNDAIALPLMRFAVDMRCAALAQLVIDDRQQLLGGAGIALLDFREDEGDVAHCAGSQFTAATGCWLW